MEIYNSIHAAMKNYHQNEMTHGEIYPLMIGKRIETQEYILLDRLRDPTGEQLKQQQNLITGKQKIFMSPELYEKLKGKQKGLQIDFK